mgnify:CR=1 FL=1
MLKALTKVIQIFGNQFKLRNLTSEYRCPMKNSYEKVKFLVTRNVFIFTCFAMILLVIMNVILQSDNLPTAVVAVLFSLAVLIYLIRSKSYFIPSILALILGYSLNLYNLFKASNFENFVDLFWLINLSIFAYFTFGKLIGHVYLTLNISSIFIISVLTKLKYISLIPTTEQHQLSAFIEFGFNLIVCSVFFGYLLSVFLRQNNIARKKSIKSNLELQKQYNEKSIMLKEIHHRVKNNLQVVTSLLRLQLHKIKDKKTAEPFQESIDRIASMALIHQKMYQGDKVKAINIQSYIKDLADNLIKNYSKDAVVTLNINSSIDTIELNHIVPLSLILNELISNSLKHAFKNKTNGEITINILTSKSTNLQLSYTDSGEWRLPKQRKSFGLELIDTFTEQLNGEYTLNSEKSAFYNFNFKNILAQA